MFDLQSSSYIARPIQSALRTQVALAVSTGLAAPLYISAGVPSVLARFKERLVDPHVAFHLFALAYVLLFPNDILYLHHLRGYRHFSRTIAVPQTPDNPLALRKGHTFSEHGKQRTSCLHQQAACSRMKVGLMFLSMT